MSEEHVEDVRASDEQKGFEPPRSQAELDRIISERVQRERSKFADYNDLKKAAKRLDEIEAANKTELERLTERATQAEARVRAFEAAAQITAWKQQVSDASGVPASVLAGSTLEEIEAHAARVKSLMPPDIPSRVTGPYVPSEGTGAGHVASTRDQFADAMREALHLQ